MAWSLHLTVFPFPFHSFKGLFWGRQLLSWFGLFLPFCGSFESAFICFVFLRVNLVKVPLRFTSKQWYNSPHLLRACSPARIPPVCLYLLCHLTSLSQPTIHGALYRESISLSFVRDRPDAFSILRALCPSGPPPSFLPRLFAPFPWPQLLSPSVRGSQCSSHHIWEHPSLPLLDMPYRELPDNRPSCIRSPCSSSAGRRRIPCFTRFLFFCFRTAVALLFCHWGPLARILVPCPPTTRCSFDFPQKSLSCANKFAFLYVRFDAFQHLWLSFASLLVLYPSVCSTSR